MARYVAAPADACPLLDLDERTDLGVVANGASMEFEEIGKLHVVAQLDVARN